MLRKIKVFFLCAFLFGFSTSLLAKELTFSPALNQDKNTGPVWLAYGLALSAWKVELNASGKPNLFKREVFAKSKQAAIWDELRNSAKNPKKPNAGLDALVVVNKAGFIREYVWYYLKQDGWEKPKDLKMQEFLEWSKTHLKDHVPAKNPGVSLQ